MKKRSFTPTISISHYIPIVFGGTYDIICRCCSSTILPQFKAVFESTQIELPPLTAALFAGGTWLQDKHTF